MKNIIVSPSILSSDFSNLESEIKKLDASDCEWIHFDVMDGHFVPNLTFGAPVIKSVRKYSKKIFDVHLMMENPLDYLDAFVDAGSDYICVHVESMQIKQVGVKKALEMIKSKGVKAGIVLQPDTSVEEISSFINDCDLVLIMSVYAGFGGQSFIEKSINKIVEVKNVANDNVLVSIDGGINNETAKLCKDAGIDVLIAGSYIFNGDINERINLLK